jgi:hypothetical protein
MKKLVSIMLTVLVGLGIVALMARVIDPPREEIEWPETKIYYCSNYYEYMRLNQPRSTIYCWHEDQSLYTWRECGCTCHN